MDTVCIEPSNIPLLPPLVEITEYLMVLYTPYTLFTMVRFTPYSPLLFPAHSLLKVGILLFDTADRYELLKLPLLVEIQIAFHYSARHDTQLLIMALLIPYQ